MLYLAGQEAQRQWTQHLPNSHDTAPSAVPAIEALHRTAHFLRRRPGGCQQASQVAGGKCGGAQPIQGQSQHHRGGGRVRRHAGQRRSSQLTGRAESTSTGGEVILTSPTCHGRRWLTAWRTYGGTMNATAVAPPTASTAPAAAQGGAAASRRRARCRSQEPAQRRRRPAGGRDCRESQEAQPQHPLGPIAAGHAAKEERGARHGDGAGRHGPSGGGRGGVPGDLQRAISAL